MPASIEKPLGDNYYQTIGLFLLSNILIVIHGIVRIVFYSGSSSWDANGGAQFPPGLLLAAAVVEVSFSTVGLIVSLAGMFGDFQFVKRYIKAVVVFSIFGGWFAFLSFALGNEIFNLVKYPSDQTFGRVMGFLGIIGYCAALIGQQAFFGIKLMHSVHGKSSTYKARYLKSRFLYYNTLLLLVGLVCLSAGAYAVTVSGTAGNVVQYNQVALQSEEGYSNPVPESTYPEPEGTPEAEAEGEPEAEAEGEPEAEAEGEPEAEAKGEPEAEAKGEPEAEAEGEPEAEAKGEPEAEAEGAPEGSPEASAEGAPEGSPEASAEGAPEGSPEASAEGSPEGGSSIANLGDYPPWICIVPAMNIIVGLCIVGLSLWGYVRVGGIDADQIDQCYANDDIPVGASGGIDAFCIISCLVWLLHFIYVGLVAPGYTSRVIASVQISVLSVALHFVPVYLDSKIRALVTLAPNKAASKSLDKV